MTDKAEHETAANGVKRLPNGEYLVVHPLDDIAEQKVKTEGLGYASMTPMVRWSLIALRSYLIIMTLMVVYRCLQLAHIIN